MTYQPMREIDYGNNVAQRTLCVLVLDVSGTMSLFTKNGHKRIDMLNAGVKAFYDDLMNDETARNRVRVAIIAVGGVNDGANLILDWTDAVDLTPLKFSEGGFTPLGEGMLLAIRMIETERQNLRNAGISYTRPWIITMSDGLPTDNADVWLSATQQCQRAEQAKECVIYPIGIETGDSEMAMLQQLSVNNLPKHMDAVKFVEFFVWLSASLRKISQSAPEEVVQLGSISPWETVRN